MTPLISKKTVNMAIGLALSSLPYSVTHVLQCIDDVYLYKSRTMYNMVMRPVNRQDFQPALIITSVQSVCL